AQSGGRLRGASAAHRPLARNGTRISGRGETVRAAGDTGCRGAFIRPGAAGAVVQSYRERLGRGGRTARGAGGERPAAPRIFAAGDQAGGSGPADRKSTRLNSSHGSISYAVFCLKKKKKK